MWSVVGQTRCRCCEASDKPRNHSRMDRHPHDLFLWLSVETAAQTDTSRRTQSRGVVRLPAIGDLPAGETAAGGISKNAGWATVKSGKREEKAPWSRRQFDRGEEASKRCTKSPIRPYRFLCVVVGRGAGGGGLAGNKPAESLRFFFLGRPPPPPCTSPVPCRSQPLGPGSYPRYQGSGSNGSPRANGTPWVAAAFSVAL